MNLYRTIGGRWVGTKADWKAAMQAEGHEKPGANPDPIDVPITPKEKLIDFLNEHCPAPTSDDTQGDETITPPVTITTIPGARVDLDELFEKAPPAKQLALAVQAIDNAEATIRVLVSHVRGGR